MGKRKADLGDNPNQDICDLLIELAEYERNVSKNIHKYNAYRKAASTLSSLSYRIESGKQAKKLDGIGQKIADKIDEFLNTGKLRKVAEIREDETAQAINILTRVSGIGASKAQELVRQGIDSIEKLKENKDKLNHHQLIGLKYLEDFEKKIPREEVSLIEKRITKIISLLSPKFTVTVCGSYRRGKSESGDVDVLMTHSDYTSNNVDKHEAAKYLKSIVDKLKEENLITETISLGDVKFMGVYKINDISRRLDIRITPLDQYFCATLYFTGSDMFNKQMRAHALEKSFTLNEYCLRPVGITGVVGEALPVTSEEDIFDYIDYPYKHPTERNI